jgi:hypothetical protein
MEKASEFDDKDSLTVPVNHILAIVENRMEAEVVISTLHKNGFPPDEVGILAGTEDSSKLDAATGKKGLFAKLATTGVDAGDRDTDYIGKYRRALLNGRTVIGVVATNDETRNEARQILKVGRARFITFFGRFATEVLEG